MTVLAGATTSSRNFSAALHAALGVPTRTLPPDLRPDALTQDLLDSAGGSSTVVGIEYWNKNYNANPNRAVVYTTTDENRCNGGDSFQVSNVGAYDNDKYSSARNYGGCDIVRHFEHAGFDGAMLDCSPCGDLGALNNRTTSLKWKP
ncbi:MAG TPA: hypothetical protein VHJ34_06530 [Actinomycetota bacterium]|nr:hypothetical protein [Actinomycetota bacterium]